MDKALLQDWTDADVMLRPGEQRSVRYRVYRRGDRHHLQVSEPDGVPIHVLELPDGMRLDASSYEVLLRYVLIDLAA